MTRPGRWETPQETTLISDNASQRVVVPPAYRVYSIRDVAQLTGKTYKQIWGWIAAGEMVSRKIRGRHLITAAELERLGLVEPATAALNSG